MGGEGVRVRVGVCGGRGAWGVWEVRIGGGKRRGGRSEGVRCLIKAPPAAPGSRVCLGLEVPSIRYLKIPYFSFY